MHPSAKRLRLTMPMHDALGITDLWTEIGKHLTLRDKAAVRGTCRAAKEGVSLTGVKSGYLGTGEGKVPFTVVVENGLLQSVDIAKVIETRFKPNAGYKWKLVDPAIRNYEQVRRLQGKNGAMDICCLARVASTRVGLVNWVPELGYPAVSSLVK